METLSKLGQQEHNERRATLQKPGKETHISHGKQSLVKKEDDPQK